MRNNPTLNIYTSAEGATPMSPYDDNPTPSASYPTHTPTPSNGNMNGYSNGHSNANGNANGHSNANGNGSTHSTARSYAFHTPPPKQTPSHSQAYQPSYMSPNPNIMSPNFASPMSQYHTPTQNPQYEQQQQQQQQQEDPNKQKMTFAQKIKNYDYQNNIPSEFRVYTTHGAILSFTTILLLLYLLSSEYTYNMTYTTREKVHVATPIHNHHENFGTNNNSKENTMYNHLIEMEIDITFPNIACALLSLDAFDPINQRQTLHLDYNHRIWKHRIAKDGTMIGRRSKFELGNTLHNEEHLEEYAKKKDIKFVKKDHTHDKKGLFDDYYYANEDETEMCGSCYGAGDEDECCNTCDDVKRAYQRKGWNFEPNLDVQQCHHTQNSNKMVGEGCNVHGIVSLSSGGGNLHITPGHELENFGKTFAFTDLTDLIAQSFETFNVTHTVNKLRFGREYPGDIHQLDGEVRKIDDTSGMFQYYFQVVPTEYRFLNGT
jgi:hypothetical protein